MIWQGPGVRSSRRRPSLLLAFLVAVVALAAAVVIVQLRGGGGATDAAPASAVVSSTTTAPSPRPTVAVDANGVPVAVRTAVAAAGGDVAVAVYDATTGRGYTVDDSARFVTASVVKLSILGETLRQQQNGRELGTTTRSELAGMIENSNNDDASALWDAAGYGPAVVGYDTRVGTTSTTADSGGYWGLTLTSAADQVTVMRSIAYPNAVLTDASRAYANTLLAAVQDDQRWGATGGVPAGVSVLVKNGWLPHGSGWVVHTVAHVSGLGRDYVVAIMSADNATEAAGIARLEAVSAAVWATAGQANVS